jgi:hypothetical protein
MEPTTQLIVGLLVSSILVGILITLYVKIFAKKSGGGDTCQPGTTEQPGFGCMSCDPNDSACATCTTDGAKKCQNGGTCTALGTGGTAGVCVCPAPYFGNNCEKQCSADVPCASGTCLPNGTCSTTPGSCTAANCIAPHCDPKTCLCADGWADDPNDPTGKKCGTCAPGRGPPGDCSKKIFTNSGLKLALPECYDVGWRSAAELNGYCQNAYGNSSSWDPTAYECYPNLACNSTTSRPICDVPNFMANPTFPLSTIQTCPTNCPSSADPTCDSTSNWIEPYKVWQWFGGSIYTPPNTTQGSVVQNRKPVTKATAAAMRK